MNTRKITIVTMAISAIALIAWDVYVILTQEAGGGGTISEILRDWSVDIWTIPFAVGVLVGHWFLTNPKIEAIGMKWTGPRLLGGAAPVVVWDVLHNIAELTLSEWWLPLPVAYGILIGYLFWATMPRKSKGA